MFLRIANIDSQEGVSRSGDEMQHAMTLETVRRRSDGAAMSIAVASRRLSRSDAEFGFEQVVDGLRIGLAAR